MTAIIITAPDDYTLYRCIKEGDGVRVQPPLPTSLRGLQIFNGEVFEAVDLATTMTDFFKAGVIFALPCWRANEKTPA